MRIAVVTIATSNLNFREYAIDNSRDYCGRHGYDFILYDEKIDANASAISNKTIAVLQNIDEYDWILMKDADSLFYNFNYKIEGYVDDNYNYIGSWSCIPDTINLGHLLIKCTPQVKEELTRISQEISEKVEVKGEQPIYNEYWKEGKISPIKDLPKHVFNAQVFDKINREEWTLTIEDLQKLDNENLNFEACGDVRNDTFIIHYPGAFLKSRSYLHERLVHTTGEADIFNFSDSYLPEFIKMSEIIKNRYNINGKNPIKMTSVLKPRVQRHQRKKIKYNKK
jgi:hypothetical protein